MYRSDPVQEILRQQITEATKKIIPFFQQTDLSIL